MKFPSYSEMLRVNRQRDGLMYAAKLGMSPFRSKDIVIFEDFDIDMNQYRLGIEWRTATHVFPFKVRYDRDDLIGTPEEELLRLMQKILQYYRFDIPTIPMFIEETPTHPHIIVGEN